MREQADVLDRIATQRAHSNQPWRHLLEVAYKVRALGRDLADVTGEDDTDQAKADDGPHEFPPVAPRT